MIAVIPGELNNRNYLKGKITIDEKTELRC